MQPPIRLIDDSVLAEARRRAERAVRHAIDAGLTIDQAAGVFTQVFWKTVDELLAPSEKVQQGEPIR